MVARGSRRWGGAALLAATAALCGCGTPPIKPGFVSATQTAPLQIPPGLTPPPSRPEDAIPTLSKPLPPPSDLPDTKLEKPPIVALETDEIRMEHDGALYWLVIQESQDEVWIQALAFWKDRHVKLVFQNPRLGVMETDWITPPGQPAGGGPGGLRDKFRVRLEHYADVGNTEVYVTDRVVRRSVGPGGAVQEVAQPSDLDAAGLILHGIEVNIGGPEMTNLAPPRPQPQPPYATPLRRDGELQALKIAKTEDMAWRHVAAAVDRLGYTLITDDPAQRHMLISTGAPRTVIKKRGFWARLFSPGATTTETHVPVYQLIFTPEGVKTPTGKAAKAGSTAAAEGERRHRRGHPPQAGGQSEGGAAGEAAGKAAAPPADHVRLSVVPQSGSGAQPADAGKILQAIYEHLQ